MRIDLTRMECKVCTNARILKLENSIDLTRMECKGDHAYTYQRYNTV